MADTAKRLCLQIMPTAFAADPGFYKANEAGNINTIIRHIHVSSIVNASAWFHMTISPAAGVDDWNRRIFSQATIGPYGGLDWTGFMVMAPGEFISGFASTASALTLCISGIVIT